MSVRLRLSNRFRALPELEDGLDELAVTESGAYGSEISGTSVALPDIFRQEAGW
jgi:hypothetical protein